MLGAKGAGGGSVPGTQRGLQWGLQGQPGHQGCPGTKQGLTSQSPTPGPSCLLAGPVCCCAGLCRAGTLLCQCSFSERKSPSGAGIQLIVPWVACSGCHPHVGTRSSPSVVPATVDVLRKEGFAASHAFLACSDLSLHCEIQSSPSVTLGGYSRGASTGPQAPFIFCIDFLNELQGLVLGPAPNGRM